MSDTVLLMEKTIIAQAEAGDNKKRRVQTSYADMFFAAQPMPRFTTLRGMGSFR
jgi:hypothetical protein